LCGDSRLGCPAEQDSLRFAKISICPEAAAHSVSTSCLPDHFLGGSIAGVLDGLDAVTFYGLADAVSPAHLFQSIASGLVGPRAFQGGWFTVVCRIRRCASLPDHDRSLRGLLRGESSHSSPVSQALDLRAMVRSRPVLLHAAYSFASVGGGPAYPLDAAC